MIADIITIIRIPFSLLLLFLSPYSPVFAILYILCGITDILDGFLARKLHKESEKGAMLDSTADLFFAISYAVKILPALSIPFWVWIWTAIIALIKVIGITISSKKVHRLHIEHSFGNKLTGLLLFLLPISVCIVDVKYTAIFICAFATSTAVKEIINIF